MKMLNTLIKPASGRCNLQCKYCFYNELVNRRELPDFKNMSLDTIETIVKKAFEATTEGIAFAFQGGEPTLVGLDFYKSFVEYVKLHNTNNINVSFSIQTNGINIDKDFAKFLGENNFLVGLSLDGPKQINDEFRVNFKDNGSYKTIMKTARMFEQYNVDFNILSVVNKLNANQPSKLYNFFRNENFRYLQFIPCLNPDNQFDDNYDYSLTPKDYGKFLMKIFDLWYEDLMNKRYVSIRYFDNIVGIMLGNPPESCDMNGYCSINAVIESDGSIYPCDFYVDENWQLGNIHDEGFETILSKPLGREFVNLSLVKDPICDKCRFFPLCRSGCRRHKDTYNGTDNSIERNYFCESYKMLFNHSVDRFENVARLVQSNPEQFKI